jgi:mannose/fructose/N-acetylgalactosamine-specific phosphotransferase system component IID
MLDGYTSDQLWQIANIAGLVVVGAVAALLTILVLLVRTIEQRVTTIRETLKQAVANTSDSALIAETAKRVEAVLIEGLEHHLFLGRVLDKVRS